MKKILIFLAIVIIIIAVAFVNYSSYKNAHNAIMKDNLVYEEYKDKEVYGLDIATLINKTVDKNTKNRIEKDEQGMYISNDTNSIQIEIYMQDNETTYQMEAFYKAGMEKFIQYYGNIKFKCSKIEYHEKTKRVKYILFEQIVTS